MNEIKIFENESFGQIRTAGTSENPLFCLSDVCKALDLQAAAVARRLEKDVISSHPLETSGGTQQANFVNEDGLYDVILDSRKPEAKAFRKWITGTVLPSIRKTGSYASAPTTYLEALKALVASEEEKERLRLESKKKDEDIERMKPKEGYFDDLVDRNLLTNFRDTAKELGLGQKEFINYLLRDGFLYRAKGFRKQLKPCAEYAKDLFAIKDCKSSVNFWAGNQTMITPKGKETFRLLYGEKHNQLVLF